VTPDERQAYLSKLSDRDDAGERSMLQLGPMSRAMLPGVIWFVTENGPEPPNRTRAESDDLVRRELAGERIEVPVGPHTAMLLILAFQRVMRHQGLDVYGPGMFQQVLDQLRMIFIDDPVAAEIIHDGEKNHP
jgi:hypothetical protein